MRPYKLNREFGSIEKIVDVDVWNNLILMKGRGSGIRAMNVHSIDIVLGDEERHLPTLNPTYA